MKNIIEFAKITKCDFVYSECSEEDVDYVLKHRNEVAYSRICLNVKLTNEQFDILFNMSGGDIFYLAQNPYLNEDQFMQIYHRESDHRGLAQNPNITEKQINLLLNTKGTDSQIFTLKACLVSNKNINPIIRQKIIDDTIKQEVFK